MEKFYVFKKDKKCPVYIGKDILCALPGVFLNKGIKKACVMTSNKVANLYLKDILKTIRPALGELKFVVLPDGERYKSFCNLEKIYLKLLKNKVKRDFYLISLGGGVIGDLTGFAASTYLRGIGWINIPTTVLSCADSSIGGKTGLNLPAGKNLAGSFYNPEFVFINLDFLKTLSDRQYKYGLAEIIKTAVISSKDSYNSLFRLSRGVKDRDIDVIYPLIKKSLKFKAGIVECDPEEKSIRAVLNFGHTIGHALEVANKYKLHHGQAVAMGILGACWLSSYLGILSEEKFARIADLLNIYKLIKKGTFINPGELIKYIQTDKKNASGSLKMVLIKDIGSPQILEVSESLVLKAIKYLKAVSKR